jgi:hypothetical protein
MEAVSEAEVKSSKAGTEDDGILTGGRSLV